MNEYYFICKISELNESVGKRFYVNDTDIAVFKVEEEVYVLGNVCPHQQAPSIYEGFGIPLLEAMVCKCPILASNIPSSIEVAADAAIYFDLEHQESLIMGLNKLVEDGKQSEKVQIGAERVKHFSWEKAAQETLEAYRGLC